MPRKEISFYCDICGRKYGKETEATKCEQGHLVPISADKPEFDSSESIAKREYPESVLIHFSSGDGKKAQARYYRKP